MNRNAELAGAALGGYVLGRTKKGKAAIRLAMWLSGDQGQQVIAFTRNGITTLIASEAGQQLIGSVREQAQNRTKALTSGLTDNLTERTKALGAVSEGGKDALGKVTGKKKKDEPEDDEQEEPDTEEQDTDEEPDEEERREELEGMGIRALRVQAKRYYQTDALRNASREDLIDWVIEAEYEEDDDGE